MAVDRACWHVSSYEGGWTCVRNDQEQIIAKLGLNVPEHAALIAAAPDGLALAHAVAAHFKGTDAPLGQQARDFIAKATTEKVPA